MKRDMDLIRRIALAVENLEANRLLSGLADVEKAEYSMHAIWMEEAGLIRAVVQEYTSGEAATVHIRRLTWEGCEFVEAIRDDTLWSKAKANVLRPGMSFTFGVLKDWLKTEITQGFPTLRNLN